MPVGCVVGGTACAQGLIRGHEDAHLTGHGFVWRPVLYGASGAIGGMVVGLYWVECGTAMVLYDIYRSYNKWLFQKQT